MKPGVALDGRWLDGLADRCDPDARQMNSVRARACGTSTENNDRPPSATRTATTAFEAS
jgi:hypothetical protein